MYEIYLNKGLAKRSNIYLNNVSFQDLKLNDRLLS